MTGPQPENLPPQKRLRKAGVPTHSNVANIISFQLVTLHSIAYTAVQVWWFVTQVNLITHRQPFPPVTFCALWCQLMEYRGHWFQLRGILQLYRWLLWSDSGASCKSHYQWTSCVVGQVRILYSCLAYVQADTLLITVPPEKYLAAPNMVPHISLSHTSVRRWPACQSTVKPAKPWPKLLHNNYICSNYLPSMYIPPQKSAFSWLVQILPFIGIVFNHDPHQ